MNDSFQTSSKTTSNERSRRKSRAERAARTICSASAVLRSPMRGVEAPMPAKAVAQIENGCAGANLADDFEESAFLSQPKGPARRLLRCKRDARLENKMAIHDQLPHIEQQILNQPLNWKFGISDVGGETWDGLERGDQIRLGMEFKQLVLAGAYENVFAIEPSEFKGSQEYVRIG